LLIAVAAAAAGYSLDDPPPGVNIAGTCAQDLAMIVAALFFAHMAWRPRGADFGLLRTPTGKAVGAMIAVWVAFIGFSVVWKAAISLDEPQTLPDELGIDGSTVNLVLVVVIITILAPLCEEFLFLGYVFGALRIWHGDMPAVIRPGVIFCSEHYVSSHV